VSLQAILEQIRRAGNEQVSEVLAQAEQEAETVLAEAQARARQQYQAAYRQALAPEAGASARIINQTRFEVDCLAGQAREQFVDQVLQQARSQLSAVRGTEGYLAVLRQTLQDVLPAENGQYSVNQQIVLEADPRDRDALEALLAEKGLAVQVDYCLSCWGGLNAHSPDGSIRLINTLESRLERALPYLKQQLLAGLERRPAGEQEKVSLENVRL